MNPAFVSPALSLTASPFTPRLATSTRRPFTAARTHAHRAARMQAEADDAAAASAPEAVAPVPAPQTAVEGEAAPQAEAEAGEQAAGSAPDSIAFSAANDDDIDVEVEEELAEPQDVINAAAVKEAQQKFKLHDTDSGSPEFQIATQTARITYLTEHLKRHPKDYASTRGLLKMVATRRKLLKYLKSKDVTRFNNIIEGLNIRISQQLREL